MQTHCRGHPQTQCIAFCKTGMACREISIIVGIAKSFIQNALKPYSMLKIFRQFKNF